MKPKRVLGTAVMLLGAVSSIAALWLLITGVNAVAYLMGAGEEVTVTVTEASSEGYRTDEEGHGYYEQGGERFEVSSSHVAEGEVVVTRLPIVPLDLSSATSIHANDDAARSDLWNFIGVALLGFFGHAILRNGWHLATVGDIFRRPRKR